MDELHKPLDLQLWQNEGLIRQQNFLKSQFLYILNEVAGQFLPQEFADISFRAAGTKISRGNDLNGLPYQVLDLIRDFDTLDGANIRLLNWFGVGFFMTVLLGKNRANPVQQLLEAGFHYGLCENKWDYPDLIVNKNQTGDPLQIQASNPGFHQWVRPVSITTDPNLNIGRIGAETKKILGILKLAGKLDRN